MKHRLSIFIFMTIALLAAAVHGSDTASDRIRCDPYGLQIDGRDTFIYSGAFHYFRVPKELWPDRFQKMKDAGFNCVETYVPWNYHERTTPGGINDFSHISGLQDLDDWISLAEQFGFYVIIRPGPYICSEWDGGGFPQWLVSQKKPANWPADKSWLQSDDAIYLSWEKHWYDAVCPVVAKHQVTRKAAGQPGIILFQIENEYNRVNWLAKTVKRHQLEALARFARKDGIDVPIFTCWTSESRGATNGPLVGVLDMVNCYPKWNVAKELSKFTGQTHLQQRLAPLMSMELQGGWYSEVGGVLSRDLDYTAPEQMQNLTLYALQLGYSLVNFYMLVGGSNFDDWASRETTQTYDFAAAIGEAGITGEKYRRVAAIGRMLQDHGPRLLRAETVEVEITNSNPAVEIVERQAQDGARYFFIRTENHFARQKGKADIKEVIGGNCFVISYELEPFGSVILYLPPGITSVADGEWLPKISSERPAPQNFPPPIVMKNVQFMSDPVPQEWIPLTSGDSLENHGVLNRHFVYYKIFPPAGRPFTVNRLGEKVVRGTKADGVLAQANGRLLLAKSSDTNGMTFEMPVDASEAVLLFENRGLQQHPTPLLEQHWRNGIGGITSGTNTIPLEFAANERESGIRYSQSSFKPVRQWSKRDVGRDSAIGDALLGWYRVEFALPAEPAVGTKPWFLHLEARGNGFIYVNGQCLGRYWQAGPQHDFYLPEPWLQFGPGKTNSIAISLRPMDSDIEVQAISILSKPAFEN